MQPAGADEAARAASGERDLLFDLLVGELAGRQGDLKLAAQAYVEAAQVSDDPAVAGRATRVALYAGDFERALQAAERWAGLAPDDPEVLQVLGVLHARLGHEEEAVRYLGRLLEPRGEGGYRLVGSLLGQQVAADTALRVMQRLVARAPERFEAWHALAVLALRLERPDEALHAIERALSLQPRSIEGRLMHARVLLALGQTQRALDEARRLVADHPARNDVRLALAQMLVQAGEYEKARQRFEQVLARQPDNADLVYTLGLLNIEMKRLAEAERYLLRVLELGRHVYDASYYLGQIAEQRGDYRRAVSWYLRVTDGPYRADAQARVALMLARLGRIDEAREHLRRLRQAADSGARQIRLYIMESEILMEAGRFEEARALLDEAMRLHPGEADLEYARAMLAAEEGDLETMERLLKALIARNPEDARALNALGYVLADRTERYLEALGFIRRAIELKPEDPAIQDSMGWVLYRLGKLDEAERWLRKALDKLFDDEIGSHLVELLWQQGRMDEARALYRRLHERFPDSRHLKRLRDLVGQ